MPINFDSRGSLPCTSEVRLPTPRSLPDRMTSCLPDRRWEYGSACAFGEKSELFRESDLERVRNAIRKHSRLQSGKNGETPCGRPISSSQLEEARASGLTWLEAFHLLTTTVGRCDCSYIQVSSEPSVRR